MPYIKNISDTQLKTLPEFKPGYTVKVYQRIKEGGKERVQVFEGLVIARKGGKGANASFMVRKISYGIGVERIFPLHSPNIVKLEVVKKTDVRKSKIYYVRDRQDNTPRSRKAKQKSK
ncbi:MAG: 50S ribosomal protein L19 [Candidatus Doudnabacteria bacterium]|nr:50S ribosomal protein L19 [Candidatus Doudnabacteria bacterium]